jgi:hypothetical protein
VASEECEWYGSGGAGKHTVYGNVSALLEPLDEHLEAIFCNLLAKLGGFYIVVAEVTRRMIFENATPVEKARVIVCTRKLSLTVGLFCERVNDGADQH